MAQALALLVEQRAASQQAGSLRNNRAIARYPFQGPARSLADFEEGIAFCEQRGLADGAAWMGAVDLTVEALAAAAAGRLAQGLPDQARALLVELEETPGARETSYYARLLGAMVRTALAAGDPELAARLADGLEPLFPLREHALCAARARLAKSRWRPRRGRHPLRRRGRPLAAVRERPRARPRPARPGPLPRGAREAGGGAAVTRSARLLRIDGLQPRARRDRRAARRAARPPPCSRTRLGVIAAVDRADAAPAVAAIPDNVPHIAAIRAGFRAGQSYGYLLRRANDGMRIRLDRDNELLPSRCARTDGRAPRLYLGLPDLSRRCGALPQDRLADGYSTHRASSEKWRRHTLVMMGDDLLRKGLESARTEADQESCSRALKLKPGARPRLHGSAHSRVRPSRGSVSTPDGRHETR